MTRSVLTTHANSRLQQRAIPHIVIDLLHQYGSTMRSHQADVLFFDKAAKRRLQKDWGGPRSVAMIERWLNVYAVVADDGALITVGHQTRRHRRR